MTTAGTGGEHGEPGCCGIREPDGDWLDALIAQLIAEGPPGHPPG